MDLNTLGSIASVIGIVAAAAIAVYQRGEALNAERKAETARARAASLEDHLASQRWQQLRSLGEQIDALELQGGHKHKPMEAALHARLKEQYAALVGIVATSTPGFSASTVRHWVTIGRLPRPWQIAEAITHLDKISQEGVPLDDQNWLAELIRSGSIVPTTRAIQPPRELNQFVASYILIANSVRDELKNLLAQGRPQTKYSALFLLYLLALDCNSLLSRKKGGLIQFCAWGWESGKSFRERIDYYNEQDFWIISMASQKAQGSLKGFEHMFEPMASGTSSTLLPTADAAEIARARYPNVAEVAAIVLQAHSL